MSENAEKVEISKRSLELLNDLFHDHVTVMQAAWIEWHHGKGAEAAMHWIHNTLWGPGLIPDEDAAYGREAQAWFDANRAKPFPACECGRPSHILAHGKGFCSQEHANAEATRSPTQ